VFVDSGASRNFVHPHLIGPGTRLHPGTTTASSVVNEVEFLVEMICTLRVGIGDIAGTCEFCVTPGSGSTKFGSFTITTQTVYTSGRAGRRGYFLGGRNKMRISEGVRTEVQDIESATTFPTLDLSSGHWHILLADHAKKYRVRYTQGGSIRVQGNSFSLERRRTNANRLIGQEVLAMLPQQRAEMLDGRVDG
jgi:hypothetical protein